MLTPLLYVLLLSFVCNILLVSNYPQRVKTTQNTLLARSFIVSKYFQYYIKNQILINLILNTGLYFTEIKIYNQNVFDFFVTRYDQVDARLHMHITE